MHFAFLQIMLGALVAGIDAGRAFPTWPLMNGQFFPADAFYVPDGNGGSLPVWHAFFENPGLVQFIHRMSGYLLLAFGVVVWLRGREVRYQATQAAFHAVMAMLVAQMVLGIATVLTVAHVACGDHPSDRRGDPVGADPAGAASVAIPRGGVDPERHGMTRVMTI